MADLLLEFSPEESEILKSLEKAMGDQITVVKPDRFGGADLVHVIVPLLTPFATALATILVAYFKPDAKGKKDRKVVYDGKVLHLENYSEAEVEKLLEKLGSKKK
jgi:hypothetical protein